MAPALRQKPYDCTNKIREEETLSLRRQDRDDLHFELIGRIGEPRNLQQGVARQRRLVREVAAAHLAIDGGVGVEIGVIGRHLDDVLEARADRTQQVAGMSEATSGAMRRIL